MLEPTSYTFNVYAIPLAVTTFSLLLLGVAVLIQERAARIAVAFFAITLALSLWLAGLTGTYCATDERVALSWAKLGFTGIPFIASTIYLFSVVVMDIYARRKALVWVSWLLSLCFVAVNLSSPALITHVQRYWWGYYPQYGWLGLPFIIFFCAVVLLTMYDYWVEYRRADPGTHKQRLRVLLIAFSIVYLAAVDYLPCYGMAIYPFGYLAVFVWIAVLARTIRQYRLIEIAPAFAANEILATMADPLAVCDADGRIRVVNQALCTTLGYAQSELLGRSIEALADARNVAQLRQLLAAEAARDEEMVWRTRTGAPVAVRISVSSVRERTGTRLGTVLIARDIREWKQAEAALRTSEERTRLIIDNALDPVITMDATGAVIGWNSQAEIVFGWSRDEIIGHSLAETIVPPRYRVAHTRGIEHFLATGEGPVLNKSIEITALHRDGHELPIELSIWPVQQGETLTFSAFARDITERQRTQADLQQAKEAAEAANRAKSEFLANMSHEIRTPMNGIIGMTELIFDTAPTPEQHEYLTMVKLSADALLLVINDILDFSKIEAGKLLLDPSEFALRETLERIVGPLALCAGQKGVELSCRIAPEAPERVVGDSGRLHQILENLIGNALKFTEAGEIAIDVEAPPSTAAGQTVTLHFSVRDTGVGIPPDKVGVIFKPFEQADGSITRTHGGTGLGLAISLHLVELMGGRMWVESTVGHGSTFHFSARFGAGTGAAIVPQEVFDPANLRGLRSLIIDDSATNRFILEEMLRAWHMQPMTVDSGRAALAELRRAAADGQPFRLVLLDAMMPEMDGFAVAGEIRRHPELAGVTIMMLSSAGLGWEAARCRELGIAIYVTKPVGRAAVLDAILTALGRPSAWQTPERCAAPSPTTAAHPLKVLLAEDNPVNQTLVVRLLQKRGHAVVVAGNGRAALRALERERFDIVLMDIQMPEMDGFETTAAIRRREREQRVEHAAEARRGSGNDTASVPPRRLPIIALTAHAMKGDRERCLAAGMDHYISKPIQSRELDAVLDRIRARGLGANVGLPQSGERALAADADTDPLAPPLAQPETRTPVEGLV